MVPAPSRSIHVPSMICLGSCSRDNRPTTSRRSTPSAGIEGAFSQGVRAYGLRQARYGGLRKTQVQDVATAAAMNLCRLHQWLGGHLPATTRRSPFARLAVA